MWLELPDVKPWVMIPWICFPYSRGLCGTLCLCTVGVQQPFSPGRVNWSKLRVGHSAYFYLWDTAQTVCIYQSKISLPGRRIEIVWQNTYIIYICIHIYIYIYPNVLWRCPSLPGDEYPCDYNLITKQYKKVVRGSACQWSLPTSPSPPSASPRLALEALGRPWDRRLHKPRIWRTVCTWGLKSKKRPKLDHHTLVYFSGDFHIS